LRIYNRWGQMVFESSKAGEGWNGKFRGEEAVADVYVWKLSYRWEDDNHGAEDGHQYGKLILLR